MLLISLACCVVVARLDLLATTFILQVDKIMALINITNLTFAYPGSYDNVFERVSFQIDSNWKLGFIGRNGKGWRWFWPFWSRRWVGGRS